MLIILICNPGGDGRAASWSALNPGTALSSCCAPHDGYIGASALGAPTLMFFVFKIAWKKFADRASVEGANYSHLFVARGSLGRNHTA